MHFTEADAETLRRLLTWRRDVRHFRTDPIDEAVVERLRASLALAPSVGNSRPWRVLRIESPALREAVRAEFARCNEAAARCYEGEQGAAYGRLKLAGLEAAPLQLAVFTVSDPAEGSGLGRRTMASTLEQSTAMAVHTLWLAARAENLGLGMVSILEPGAIERLCRVPEDWRFSAYLCLGHPAAEDDLPLLHRADWQRNVGGVWETR